MKMAVKLKMIQMPSFDANLLWKPSQKLIMDENSTTNQNFPQKMITFTPKVIISP